MEVNDELEARRDKVKAELARVQRQVAELTARLAGQPPELEALSTHTAARVTALEEAQGELALLEREVGALRLEVAQARAAAEELGHPGE